MYSFWSKPENIVNKTLLYPYSAGSDDSQRLLQWLQHLSHQLGQWRAARRGLEMLRNFDDAQLKDIGLSSSDLMSIESNAIFRDSSRRKRWR